MKRCGKQWTALALASLLVLGTASSALAGQYVVQKGDYLSKIAPKYNTTWRVLAEKNNLKNPNLIYPNQVLWVPDVETTEQVTEQKPAEQKPVEQKPAEQKPEAQKPVEVPAEEKVALTQLQVDDITLKGNGIAPAFDPAVTKYTMKVQSDIYSVKVTAAAEQGVSITVDGTAVENGASTVVKLPDDYEHYGVDYSQDIVIVATKGDQSTTYTVTVKRVNAADVYALFEAKEYVDKETGVTMPYELYVPSNYDASKEYPIVFALHGSGQRTQSVDMVIKRYEMATVWAKDSEAGLRECIVLAPQCATQDDSENWTSLMEYRKGTAEDAFEMSKYSVAAYNLLQDVMKEYSVDKDRVYMTGLSAGGFATYAIAIAHPETFAALVPVCGGADPKKVSALKDIPMWIFHAADDPQVNVDEFLYPTLKALDEAGANYKKTIYEAGAVFAPSAHFSWTAAYATEDMRAWLFEQSK